MRRFGTDGKERHPFRSEKGSRNRCGVNRTRRRCRFRWSLACASFLFGAPALSPEESECSASWNVEVFLRGDVCRGVAREGSVRSLPFFVPQAWFKMPEEDSLYESWPSCREVEQLCRYRVSSSCRVTTPDVPSRGGDSEGRKIYGRASFRRCSRMEVVAAW